MTPFEAFPERIPVTSMEQLAPEIVIEDHTNGIRGRVLVRISATDENPEGVIVNWDRPDDGVKIKKHPSVGLIGNVSIVGVDTGTKDLPASFSVERVVGND